MRWTAIHPGNKGQRRNKKSVEIHGHPCGVGTRAFAQEMFNASFLFASLIWGSIGLGYFIYGKKQGSWVPGVGGLLMIVTSYFASSALVMSLISIGIIAAVYFLLKRGY